MLKFSANLSFLWPQVPLADRFGCARAAGFRRVELMFPYALDRPALARRVQAENLEVVLFNLPAGDWEAGERGIALLPERVEEFRRGVEAALAYAQDLGCPRLNCLVGRRPPTLDPAQAEATLLDNLAWAADRLADHGCKLMLEPLNRFDVPGFYLTGTEQAAHLIARLARPNVFVQYDVYHMQRMQGELIGTYRALAPLIDHIQIADNPGRHQPGTGEIHFPNLFAALEAAGYGGTVGLEYVPQGPTDASLTWLPPAARS